MNRHAIYDNPVTQRRETYINGDMVWTVSGRRCASRVDRPYRPFEPGRLVGDRRALRPYRPIRSAAVKPWGEV